MSRVKDVSEESASTTLCQALERDLKLEEILEPESASGILKRPLSVGTAHSTVSKFAEREHTARLTAPTSELRDIGRGSCGSVFEIPGTAHAIKKGTDVRSIWNDFNLTNLAHNSCVASTNLFKYSFPNPQIPRVPKAEMYNSPESEDWWRFNLLRFPKADRTEAAVFYLDRILPVTEITRYALVNKFFLPDTKIQQAVLGNIDNQDCLIRLYFGKHKPDDSMYKEDDTLRNFPLYLDQAKAIDIDINNYAREMAIGLAILHWEAQIDAADTEFVIGTSTTKLFGLHYENHQSMMLPRSTMENFTQRETQLWMLDYDKCIKISFETSNWDQDVVHPYYVAVTGNDPYFPHPCLDIKLWQIFRQAYLKASHIIIKNRNLRKEMMKLPDRVIERWEIWGNDNLATEEEDFDPFDRTDDGTYEAEEGTDSENEDDSEEESDIEEDEDITDDEDSTAEDDSEDTEQ
ncbi:hypothetical protein LTR84_007183 [Exophiala bonariae]|uniref:DUF3669 domain-containing protein n=1 Tax=Exophiala bonariae TaxID=1690606 RepID=A0AAV9MYL8_9EURO|nr:hypothetical protein LTR84_007183 [Exophiala bonariae]